MNAAPRVDVDGTAGAPPRKRRRRTGGGGATDDCFSCRRRAVKCDRKRPYCTQCIEIGKECSGYKTTLTWGVGVASRGKLRGMSYPVASKAAAPVQDGTAAGAGSTTSATSVPPKARKSVVKLERISSSESRQQSSASPSEPRLPQGPTLHPPPPAQRQPVAQLPLPLPRSYPSATPPIDIPQPQHDWRHTTGYQAVPPIRHVQHHGLEEQEGRPQPSQPILHNLLTSFPPQYDAMNMSGGASSVGSYVESEYHTAAEYPRTPRSLTLSDHTSNSIPLSYTEQSITPGSATSFAMGPPMMVSYPHEASSVDATQNTGSFTAGGQAMSGMQHAAPVYEDHMAYGRTPPMLASADMVPFAYDGFDADFNIISEEEAETPSGYAMVNTRFASPFFTLSPRMQSLMEYYSRNVCPYIVAFDGPENPYRKHILQLAMGNQGLQNAIAALSTNNLRMRRAAPRPIGFVEEITDEFDGTSVGLDSNQPTAEESMYKQLSIEQLNMQLTDTSAAQDDSVLATLLILCLFHVCDSGFSKFKTQLAGVQKLLSLRNLQSDFTRWVEMFFIWFDVMTSTVNDRETQINRESLAMLDYSANMGALEQYSGVDGRLFKLIARLGRLNLLAQGRPVRRQAQKHHLSQPFATASLSAADYDNVDGNGWGAPIAPMMSPPPPPTAAESSLPPATGDSTTQDDRREFWAEWHDLRQRLRSWSTVQVPDAAYNEGVRDMNHINESFRYSALLYTERLGNPLLPSSHDSLQYPVSQALFHITALPVTSCVNKFLLWPLFMTGTECVDEGHRNIIRLRCRQIMEESGFYNNISSLDLLERVWSEVGSNVRGHEAEEVRARRRESAASQAGKYGQAFRWRKAMDRVDGEYIVI